MKKSAWLDHWYYTGNLWNNSIRPALKCLSNLSRYFIIQWAFEAGRREPFHSTLICIRSHDWWSIFSKLDKWFWLFTLQTVNLNISITHHISFQLLRKNTSNIKQELFFIVRRNRGEWNNSAPWMWECAMYSQILSGTSDNVIWISINSKIYFCGNLSKECGAHYVQPWQWVAMISWLLNIFVNEHTCWWVVYLFTHITHLV